MIPILGVIASVVISVIVMLCLNLLAVQMFVKELDKMFEEMDSDLLDRVKKEVLNSIDDSD